MNLLSYCLTQCRDALKINYIYILFGMQYHEIKQLKKFDFSSS